MAIARAEAYTCKWGQQRRFAQDRAKWRRTPEARAKLPMVWRLDPARPWSPDGPVFDTDQGDSRCAQSPHRKALMIAAAARWAPRRWRLRPARQGRFRRRRRAPGASSLRQETLGKYSHWTITGGVGQNLPQEAPPAFA